MPLRRKPRGRGGSRQPVAGVPEIILNIRRMRVPSTPIVRRRDFRAQSRPIQGVELTNLPSSPMTLIAVVMSGRSSRIEGQPRGWVFHELQNNPRVSLYHELKTKQATTTPMAVLSHRERNISENLVPYKGEVT